jgi:extracellular elastinolytic metalloproteinase
MRKAFVVPMAIVGLCLLARGGLAEGRQPRFRTTEASPRDPMSIALDFIRADGRTRGLTEADVREVMVLSRTVSSHNQTTHIQLRQRFGGIEVANANTSISISRDGRVINLADRFVSGIAHRVDARSPRLSAPQAIAAAARQLGLSIKGRLGTIEAARGTAREARYRGDGLSLDPIPARLAYYALDSGRVPLTWEIVLRTPDQQHWWNLWVDAATGTLLDKADWIARDSYRVLALPLESPSDGKRTVETNPADPLASPFGWHDTNGASGAESTLTRGNNVRAQEDIDANNTGGFSPNGGAALNFDFPFDDTRDPSTYRPASITNLFYWNNILHDIHYQYGFDEKNGNFQQNNYGRARSGAGDPVNADAQDGSGLNNANFGTPPDGFSPRMQMFIWTPPFDSLVVVNSPPSIARNYTAASAGFGPALSTTGITGNVVLVDDGTGTTDDGCQTLRNASAINGNIAIVRRGTCTFVTKVRNAQAAGAVAVIIFNQLSDTPFGPGDDGTGGDITIPSVMIGLSDGNTITGALPGVNATMKKDPDAPANRDSAMDDGVITHEYGHGVSNRLTGGPRNVNCLNGIQSGGMGEGWSDFWALALTAKSGNENQEGTRGLATYLLYQRPNGPGLRRFPYSTDLAIDPLTYADLPATGGEVHNVGEIWTSALWDAYWNLVNDRGFEPNFYDANSSAGNTAALQLVMDGLKLQPCSPTFLDARDAILLADQNDNGGANQCLLWRAFAKRGMGVGADDGKNHNDVNVKADFSVPAECSGN